MSLICCLHGNRSSVFLVSSVFNLWSGSSPTASYFTAPLWLIYFNCWFSFGNTFREMLHISLISFLNQTHPPWIQQKQSLAAGDTLLITHFLSCKVPHCSLTYSSTCTGMNTHSQTPNTEVYPRISLVVLMWKNKVQLLSGKPETKPKIRHGH